jgi:hypothetical protein
MSEEPDLSPEPDEESAPAPPEPQRVRTGIEHVDEVITAIEQLEERPLEEHVGVFETAHAELRRALDDTDRPSEA